MQSHLAMNLTLIDHYQLIFNELYILLSILKTGHFILVGGNASVLNFLVYIILSRQQLEGTGQSLSIGWKLYPL